MDHIESATRVDAAAGRFAEATDRVAATLDDIDRMETRHARELSECIQEGCANLRALTEALGVPHEHPGTERLVAAITT